MTRRVIDDRRTTGRPRKPPIAGARRFVIPAIMTARFTIGHVRSPLLASLVALATAPALAQPAAKARAVRWQDGVYVGSNFTGLGRAKVQVTIKDGKILEVKTLSRLCSSWFGAKAYGPTEARIVAAQSTDVDAVTGATHSSGNIKKAVRNALRKAGAAADTMENPS